MTAGKKLRTPWEVAEQLFGVGRAPIEELNRLVDRRVCKSTSCGAWAKFEERPVVSTRRVTYRAKLQKTLQGALLKGLRYATGAAIKQEHWPESVLEFLLVEKCRFGWVIPAEVVALDDIKPDGRNTLRVTRQKKGLVAHVTFAVDVRRTVGAEWVFLAGSIAEGADQCADAVEVSLPCSADEISSALESVEKQAREIWNATHGCATCAGLADSPQDVAWGDVSVDPNCPACGGYGEPI